MSRYTLHCEIEIPAPIERVFAVFEDPYNLAKITPPWLGFQILTPGLTMRKGAEIDYVFLWLSFKLRWKTLITRYDPPHCFVDQALNSPYKFWHHRHSFQQTANGTRVIDRVDYAMPFGIFGHVAHELSVRNQLLQIFSFRQKAIAKLLDVQPSEIAPPSITRKTKLHRESSMSQHCSSCDNPPDYQRTSPSLSERISD